MTISATFAMTLRGGGGGPRHNVIMMLIYKNSLEVFPKWLVQTNQHTHVRNAVMLLWGSAQARPNDNPFCMEGVLAICQRNVCKCLANDYIHVIFFNRVQFGSLIAIGRQVIVFLPLSPHKMR